jgi:hypothetical protein
MLVNFYNVRVSIEGCDTSKEAYDKLCNVLAAGGVEVDWETDTYTTQSTNDDETDHLDTQELFDISGVYSPGGGHRPSPNKKGTIPNTLPRVSHELEQEIELALEEQAKPDKVKDFIKQFQSFETIPISLLSSPQTVNDPKAIDHFKDEPELIDSLEPLPLVIQYGGRLMLRDGNSRAVASQELGRPSLRARVVYVQEKK